ncbi:hypothetical protein POPTR_004G084050v4 [Populus trichocarpa]|uniref:Uncharacterized protein n=1 Tax=Populus trichocarpa TaxID=3694 RepID=A0ACC0T3N8_POPTR|nr:hypothetical protein BDE02_04G071700 [Populus trichocarpa]KAI9396146.1 hypothetical protein POPTR_004G084050v4 [Populus trichocarpa]
MHSNTKGFDLCGMPSLQWSTVSYYEAMFPPRLYIYCCCCCQAS